MRLFIFCLFSLLIVLKTSAQQNTNITWFEEPQDSTISKKEQPFSVQINFGYNYLSGTKNSHYSTKYGLGSFNSGQLPIEAELKYKLINHRFDKYKFMKMISDKWANKFTNQVYLKFAYSYQIGLPYRYNFVGLNFNQQSKYNLSSHNLRLGLIYDFTEDLEKGIQKIFNRPLSIRKYKIKTYGGIDLGAYISNANMEFNEQNQLVETHQKNTSKVFGNFIIMPQVGCEWIIPNQNFAKDKFSRFFTQHQLFVNGTIHYTLIVPSSIKNIPYLDNRKQTVVVSGVGVNIGVGVKF